MLTHNALRNNTFEVSSSERDVLERAIKHTAAYPRAMWRSGKVLRSTSVCCL